MKPFSRLFKTIVEAESIFNDKSLTWEHKYSVLFNKHKMKISPLIRKIGIDFIWIDPDTSYEEDVAAYMLSLMVLKGQIAEQAEKQERDTKALLNGQQDQAWEELRSIFYDDFNHDITDRWTHYTGLYCRCLAQERHRILSDTANENGYGGACLFSGSGGVSGFCERNPDPRHCGGRFLSHPRLKNAPLSHAQNL